MTDQDYINKLPDELLCSIFSLLSVRDAVRARSSTPRWNHLPDCRSILQLNHKIVFQNPNRIYFERPEYPFRFVKIVDQLLEKRKAQNLIAFRVQSFLGNKYASHIDSWIKSVIRMGVEEINLNFFPKNHRDDGYVFPLHLLLVGEASNLRCLSLDSCALRLSSCSTSWLRHLTELRLVRVNLYQSDLDCILTSGLNLASLTLGSCFQLETLIINGRQLCLKKMAISGNWIKETELNCPSLEIFEYSGRAFSFKFAHHPSLREAKFLLSHDARPSIFADFVKCAPKLQVLNLSVTSQVQALPTGIVTSCLRLLDIVANVPFAFDLLNITIFLDASPSLEILNLKVDYLPIDTSQGQPQKQYLDHPHIHLKEIKIEGFFYLRYEADLVSYLLRNAPTLQKMVIVLSKNYKGGESKMSQHSCINLLVVRLQK